MDNERVFDPNIFLPSQRVIGSGSGWPKDTSDLGNPGQAPQHPNTIGTGVTRGDQTLGGTLTIANDDGTQTILGQIPNDVTFGIAFLSASGSLLQKIVGGNTYTYGGTSNMYDSKGNLIQSTSGGSTYYYDPNHSYINSIIIGLLPDGSSGIVIAKPGIAATSVFS